MDRIDTIQNSFANRLDVAQGAVRDLAIHSTALFVRSGVLRPEDIDRPDRFRPTILLVGPPYSGKTTKIRLLQGALSGQLKAGELDELVTSFKQHFQLRRIIPDTSRPMRIDSGTLLGERQGDPYYFRSSADMYRLLTEDLDRWHKRSGANGRFSQGVTSAGALHRMRYCYWSHFGGDLGQGHLYGMPTRRLWKAAQVEGSALYFEGSYEPAEVLRYLLPNSLLMMFVNEFYNTEAGDREHYKEGMAPMLSAYRTNQSPDEQRFRLAYGLAITHLVLDDPSKAVDDIYRVEWGSLASSYTAINFTLRGYDYLASDPDHRQLINEYAKFLGRNRERITKLALSREIEQMPFPQVAARSVLSGLPGYRFDSSLDIHRLEIPLPAPTVLPPRLGLSRREILQRDPMNQTSNRSFQRMLCISCRSPRVRQINEGNLIKYECQACGKKNGRVTLIDRKIRVLMTEEGIKHISAAAIIINDNKMLLTDRRAAPYGLAIPVGHWEYNDTTIEDALDREVFEETSLRVTSHTPAEVSHLILPVSECRAGSDVEEWQIFNVTCEDYGTLTVNDESERLVWVPLDELATCKMTTPARYALCILGYIDDPEYVMKQEARRKYPIETSAN